jgi:glutamate racemase
MRQREDLLSAHRGPELFSNSKQSVNSLQTSNRTKLISGCTHFPLRKKLNSVALSPQANYTDRGTAACRRSCCQLLRIEGVA